MSESNTAAGASPIAVLPTEVLALCVEYLPSIRDLCAARLVCTLWGGSDQVEDLGGAVREALLALNGEVYFDTANSPLFHHFGHPTPPLGTAGPLKLFLCMCGDQLQDLTLGLGTHRDYNSILHYLAQYTPYLKHLKLSDLTGNLPDYYPGHLESGCCTLPERFFLNAEGVWHQLASIELHDVVSHEDMLHWLPTGPSKESLKSLKIRLPKRAHGDRVEGAKPVKNLHLLSNLENLSLSGGDAESHYYHYYTGAYGTRGASSVEGCVPPSVEALSTGYRKFPLDVIGQLTSLTLKEECRLIPKLFEGLAVELGKQEQQITTKFSSNTHHPVAGGVQKDESTQKIARRLRSLDVAGAKPVVETKTAFTVLLRTGTLVHLTELRLGMWVSAARSLTEKDLPSACPNLRVFGINPLPPDRSVTGAALWGSEWSADLDDPSWVAKMNHLHKIIINSVLRGCTELEVLLLPGAHIQWDLLAMEDGLYQRKLRVLGLYGLETLEESTRKSLQAYFNKAPHVPLLKELNLFACRGLTSETFDAIALRCYHLEKFFCSTPLTVNFFPDMSHRNGCMKVLHVCVGPQLMVEPFLEAVTIWAPHLAEVRVVDEPGQLEDNDSDDDEDDDRAPVRGRGRGGWFGRPWSRGRGRGGATPAPRPVVLDHNPPPSSVAGEYDYDAALLNPLRRILHGNRRELAKHTQFVLPPCAFSVGASRSRDLRAAHKQYPNQHDMNTWGKGAGWSDTAGNTIEVDFTEAEAEDWQRVNTTELRSREEDREDYVYWEEVYSNWHGDDPSMCAERTRTRRIVNPRGAK